VYNVAFVADNRCVVSFPADTLEEVNNKIKYYTNYYINECNYTIGKHEIMELCPVCNSIGYAKLKRKQMFPNKCKICKGTGGTIIDP
jgi:DnaJ-class molecular chaperone